ncbi:hypothetical protein PT974_07442 [Cladobotryum mycophilum]|uniref:Heterokaryon incompatibility domain-containing protein n=1 Tax=Cladobotryum mycophilum TaxID=491253 RepID=A0ABR0SP99_9HYPO
MAICSVCNVCLRKVCPSGTNRTQETIAVFTRHCAKTREACWICCKFSRWLEREYPEDFAFWQQGTLEINVKCANYGIIDTDIGTEPAIAVLHLAPQDTDFQDGCVIEIYFLRGQDWARLSPLTVKYPRDESNDDRIAQRWIQTCIADHDKCNTHAPGEWYPTRLLLLTPEDTSVRLIHTKEELPNAPYITLSHRWGKVRYKTLTSQTIDQFKKEIVLSGLPIALRDAITFARQISIKYIWIDALCIKQDADRSDLEIELASMHKVYSYSLLNLSATLAEQGNEPLLVERNAGPFAPSPFYFRVSGRLQTYYIVDGDIWQDEIDEAPLQKRAWVFQERFLSTRVLHFGQRQLGWECNELNSLSLFPNGLPPGFTPSTRAQVISKVKLGLGRGSTSEEFREAWADIVAKYSMCDLTMSSDKLLAFSGVVKMLEESSGDEYIAGLWKSTLVYDLAWLRSDTDALEKPWSTTRDRAPSWSWLSVDGEVTLPFMKDALPLQQFARLTQYPTPDLAGSSVASARGTIELEALTMPITAVKWEEDKISSFSVAGLWFHEGVSEDTSHLYLDGPRDEVNDLLQRGVHIVPLFTTKAAIIAVALTRLDDGSHRRIGTCQIEYRRINFGSPGDLTVPDGWTQGPPIVAPKDGRLIEDIRNLTADQLRKFIITSRSTGKFRCINLV